MCRPYYSPLAKVLGPYPILEREPLFKSERPSKLGRSRNVKDRARHAEADPAAPTGT